MKIIINDHKINIKVADTFKTRLIGLMGKKKITYGILFPKCNSIHTFFMRDNIDILMLDEKYQIKYIYENFKKYKILYKKEIKHIMELPKGSINKFKIKVNDNIKIVN